MKNLSSIASFNLGHGPLRALAHAQGQLSRNQREVVLFFALEALARVASDPHKNELRTACPGAFATLDKYRIFIDDAPKRGAMFAWELNTALNETLAGLKDVASYCRERTMSPHDRGEFRRLQMLGEATSAYLEMVQDISSPDETSLKRASKINPCVSAAFIAEYMHLVAERLDSKAKRGNDIYSAFSGRLMELRSQLRNNIPEHAESLIEIGEKKIHTLYNLMSLLSQVADLAHVIREAEKRLGDRDPQLAQSLDCLYQTAAVYDWEQFETAAPDEKKDPPVNNVFRLRPG